MAERAPPIDPRNTIQVTEQVKALLQVYLSNKWAENDPLSGALIAVFARFTELIIERLNQVPEKNFLAFLDLLGVSQLPPQLARVPLTFILSRGAVVNAVVPKGTQVATEKAPGEQQAVVFETEHELVVIPAMLSTLAVREPKEDKYSRAILAPGIQGNILAPPFQAFAAASPCEHIVYLGHPALFAALGLQEIILNFTLTKGESNHVVWERYDGEDWQKIEPTEDKTTGFTVSGNVKLTLPAPLPETVVNSITSRWLRCRLDSPIKLKWDEQSKSLVPGIKLPSIDKINITVTSARTGLSLDAALTNTQPVDLNQEFFPFGEKPKLGDSFYLAHREAFSQVGAKVMLSITVTNPKTYIQVEDKVRIIPDVRSKPTLDWRYWDGKAWKNFDKVDDQTAEFTQVSDPTKSVTIKFTVPEGIQATVLNGIENYWIRLRITSGDYGKEAGINLKTDNKGIPIKNGDDFVYTLQPSTLVPPQLGGLSLDYTHSLSGQVPETILCYNDFQYKKIPETLTFTPFTQMEDKQPAFYLGFSLNEGVTGFTRQPVSIYVTIAKIEYQHTSTSKASSSPDRQLVWEYWDGEAWVVTTIKDETEVLRHSGLIIWLPPADIRPRPDFGLSGQYWLRAKLTSEVDFSSTQLQRVLLNTTLATQAVTLTNETLGSSNENKGQRFRAAQFPVLPGQQLEVAEMEMPAAAELEIIIRDEGQDAIRASHVPSGRKSVWVRWREVPDFFGSGSRDRHYVVDRLSGEIRFGDGINGLIPPRGVGNIILSHYQTGGGQAGNKPVGTVNQLQTTLPYIDKAVNYEPASGGADPETQEAMLERAPKTLRHHHRAVTVEDFEDLALLASPKVARALCVPLLNVEQAPLENLDENKEAKEKNGAGQIGVIIVPRSNEIKPMPDMELIHRVRDYLVKHALATATISVAGPLYLSITIVTEVVLKTPEAAYAVEALLYQKLAAYLHPLTGGQNAAGWPFGESPQESDVYRLISEVADVEYVSTLRVTLGKIEIAKTDEAKVNKIRETHRFLIYSGHHKIICRY
jgi:hypothetical protein